VATLVHAKLPSSTAADSVAATATLVPITDLIYGYLERPLLVFLAAVLLVFALVAANVTTMLLARSAARAHELSVRRALGASGSRQVRQLLSESMTLTAIGGALGIVATYWIVGAIRGLGVRVLPRMDSVALDWRVLLFAIAGTILAGVVGGLAPALTARRAEEARHASGARITGQRTSATLVVAQITLSVVLLVAAGLLMKSFLRVLPTDPGFALDNRATISVSLRGQSAFPDSDRLAAQRFIRLVDERITRLKGVRDVAVMSFLPLSGMVSTTQIQVPGIPVPAKPLTAFQNFVTPNFFDVMHVELRRGRPFTVADDGSASRVAIVNEKAASTWWPGENPIGKQVTIKSREPFGATIVGLSRNGRLNGTDTRIRPEIYFPVAQGNPRNISFIVHTSVDPRSIAPELRRAVWGVAPHLAIGTTTDLATIASESVSTTRFFSWAMSAFAIAAVSLSALAVYGLLAFAVTQRRREIGIRLALGATPRAVGAMVVRRAIVLGVTGVAIGMVVARGLSRYMESLLLEVAATDASVFSMTAVAVLVVAIIAACAPAYQALRIDPVRTLREE
jgi:predicted permease